MSLVALLAAQASLSPTYLDAAVLYADLDVIRLPGQRPRGKGGMGHFYVVNGPIEPQLVMWLPNPNA